MTMAALETKSSGSSLVQSFSRKTYEDDEEDFDQKVGTLPLRAVSDANGNSKMDKGEGGRTKGEGEEEGRKREGVICEGICGF